MKSLPELRDEIADYRPDGDYPDEPLAYRCCKLALAALDDGCYGVGALLFDDTGRILAEGQNELFRHGFHSDRHAEMVTINKFEEQYPLFGDRSRLTIMVSLEPCPMCITRLLIAGIGRVIYLVEDRDGGMAGHLEKLPDVWRNLALLQSREMADISKTLSNLARELANCQLDLMRRKLLGAIRT